MSITAIQKDNKKLSLQLLGITLFIAAAFLVNKYFEWGHKIHLGIYPGSDVLMQMKEGELLFFGLYYFMTALHGFHIVVGMVLLSVIAVKIHKGTINKDNYALLENGGLYWHLVDLIWIFLFPLMYLIT
jgi:cytochrome c oxidase subunit 3